MSFFEQLEALRRKNKVLLQKLKLKTEILQCLHLDDWRKEIENETPESVSDGWALNSSARDRKPRTESNNSLLNQPDSFIKLSDRGISPKLTRNALNKPINIQKPPNRADENVQDARPDFVLLDQADSQLHVHLNPTGTVRSRSRIVPQDTGDKAVGQVRFPFAHNEQASISESDRRRLQPLLGYDWIAGLIDAENSLSERPEHFFSELHAFRQANKEECVHHDNTCVLPVPANRWTTSVDDNVTDHEFTPQSHRCTFFYRINSRLFATPLDPQVACHVCRTPKELHPHTENEPAFIRVLVPRSTLLPAYRYKAHRRRSFDPSDSLSLASHCLFGAPKISVGSGSRLSRLELRSSLEIRRTGTPPSDLQEKQPALCGSRVSGGRRSDRLLDVPHRFQHLNLKAPSNKTTKSSESRVGPTASLNAAPGDHSGCLVSVG